MKRKKSIDQLTEKKNSQNSIFLDNFSQKIPKWCGLLVDENNNSLRYELTNTCTIDYFLLAFWTSAHTFMPIIVLLNIYKPKTKLLKLILQNKSPFS